VVAVILDSAVGLHQGGQVSAPVFRRVTQQVLEYLHVPHDLPLAPQRQLLLAQSKLKDKDLADDSPDHPGEPLELADPGSQNSAVVARTPTPANAGSGTDVVQAAMRERVTNQSAEGAQTQAQAAVALSPNAESEAKLPSTGTVVLDVEQGGIEVPSFAGKTVRKAIEAAQDAGLDLEVVGSGVGRQQTPAAGTHVASGSRVTVQFGP